MYAVREGTLHAAPTIQPNYFNFFASRIIIVKVFGLEMEAKQKLQLKTELHWKTSQFN